jgi:hypothetical protein
MELSFELRHLESPKIRDSCAFRSISTRFAFNHMSMISTFVEMFGWTTEINDVRKGGRIHVFQLGLKLAEENYEQ